MTTFRVQARYVFPVASAPIENGVVEVQAGCISAVFAGPDPRARDLGNVALIPGLVNCHTHLEFSALPAPVGPPLPFTAWIRALVAYRRGGGEPVETAVRRGLEECRRTGTAVVGEIVTSAAGRAALDGAGLAVVAFRELLGLPADRIAGQMVLADSQLTPTASPVVAGLSPHAPYSVHPELYRRVVRLAAERGAPVALHLAETQAELELLRDGTGEFVSLLTQFGVWDPAAIPRGTRPLDYLEPLAAGAHALVIHGNYLDDDEIAWLAAHPHVAVVYCPRTHAYFQHDPHPWRELRQRGATVVLGTDGRGSNPDLNLWSEARFLAARHPEFPRADLLRMATLDGAAALGLESQYGAIEPGRRAAIAVIELPAESGDPHELLFGGTPAAPPEISPGA